MILQLNSNFFANLPISNQNSKDHFLSLSQTYCNFTVPSLQFLERFLVFLVASRNQDPTLVSVKGATSAFVCFEKN